MSAELDEALSAFGAHSPRFLSESENAVYAVERGGERAALRLHRPGYRGRREIWSELWWLDALAREGIDVPAPVTARNGSRLVTLSGGRLASMVTWMNGAPLDDTTATPETFYAIGILLARLHDATDRLPLPARFIRHAWDVDGLMGASPFWGRFWLNPTLSRTERSLIIRARDKAREQLIAFRTKGADFGLIHADAIRGNVFVDNGRVSLIDFDDGGFGFRAYDLAVLMTQNEDLPDSAILLAAAIAGYRSQRDFTSEAEAILPTLILARRMASMGWIVARSQPGDPRRRQYSERALKAADKLLS